MSVSTLIRLSTYASWASLGEFAIEVLPGWEVAILACKHGFESQIGLGVTLCILSLCIRHNWDL